MMAFNPWMIWGSHDLTGSAPHFRHLKGLPILRDISEAYLPDWMIPIHHQKVANPNSNNQNTMDLFGVEPTPSQSQKMLPSIFWPGITQGMLWVISSF